MGSNIWAPGDQRTQKEPVHPVLRTKGGVELFSSFALGEVAEEAQGHVELGQSEAGLSIRLAPCPLAHRSQEKS